MVLTHACRLHFTHSIPISIFQLLLGDLRYSQTRWDIQSLLQLYFLFGSEVDVPRLKCKGMNIMSKPPRLAPFDTKEQQFYSKVYVYAQLPLSAFKGWTQPPSVGKTPHAWTEPECPVSEYFINMRKKSNSSDVSSWILLLYGVPEFVSACWNNLAECVSQLSLALI